MHKLNKLVFLFQIESNVNVDEKYSICKFIVKRMQLITEEKERKKNRKILPIHS